MAKETDITTIRIPKSVKDALSDVATEREPYHATISRLINENKQLKQSVDSYNREKQSFVDTIEVLTNIVNNQDETLKSLDEILKRIDEIENNEK